CTRTSQNDGRDRRSDDAFPDLHISAPFRLHVGAALSLSPLTRPLLRGCDPGTEFMWEIFPRQEFLGDFSQSNRTGCGVLPRKKRGHSSWSGDKPLRWATKSPTHRWAGRPCLLFSVV